MSWKKKLANLIRQTGFELKPYTIRHSEDALYRKLFQDYSIDLIIDVGGNTGQYAENILGMNYDGNILSLEPLTSAFEMLEQKTKQHPRWDALKLAVGTKAEEKTINIAGNSQSSSFLDMNEIHQKAAQNSAYVGRERVQVIPLAEVFKLHNLTPYQAILLKLDIQGYEKPALEAAQDVLARFLFIELELSLSSLYQDDTEMAEMILFMQQFGFTLFSLSPGFRDRNSGRLLQADGLFIRSEKLSAL